MVKSAFAFWLLFATAVFAEKCTVDQWEGMFGSTTGFSKGTQRGLLQEGGRIHYDLTNQRMAIYATVVANGAKSKVANVTLYDKDGVGHSYFADFDEQTCNVKVFKTPFQRFCLGDSYKHVTDYYMGLQGGLKASLYQATVGGVTMDINVQDDNGHIAPVSLGSHGSRQGIDFFSGGGYFNITHGIKDEKVFDVPAPCKHGKKRSFGFTSELHHLPFSL